MNQGRIWCVVSPNVGLPLLLGSVAVTSLIVHACVMTHTTWMPNYWQGAKPRTSDISKPASVASVTPNGAAAGFTFSVSPVAATPGKAETSFVITVSPNTAVTTAASTDLTPAELKPVSVASAKLE